MKNCLAPGPDRIKPGHLKSLPLAIVKVVGRLFTRCLSECKVPTSGKISKTVLLYKKGDPDDIGKYRPLCLLSVIYKLFTCVILNRIGRILDEGQPCEQAGFRRGFSTTDHINTLTRLIEVSREYKMTTAATSQSGFHHSTRNVTLENIMRHSECDDLEVNVHGRYLHHLRFADDIVLITPNIAQAERMLAEFDNA
ncbi:hypothetical protein V3C99_018732 [Haemonchus contortus]|uniref:Reverse transcriptase domain-containing protein n=1 Tax=Haemonchus contortus TaxID=6289 RepID=A0A7I4YZU6_HAECO